MKKNLGRNISITILITIGILLLVTSASLFLQKKIREKNAVEIPVTISEIKIKGTGEDKKTTVFVTYSYNGVEYENIPINYSNSNMQVGNILKVKINRTNPGEIYDNVFLLIFILFLFGLILILASIFIIKDTKKKLETDSNTITYHATEENINSNVWKKADAQLTAKIFNLRSNERKKEKIRALMFSLPLFSFTFPMIYFVFLEIRNEGDLIVKLFFLVFLFGIILIWIFGVLIPLFFFQESSETRYIVFEAKCEDVSRSMFDSNEVTQYYGYFRIGDDYIFARISPDEYRNTTAIGKKYLFYKVENYSNTRYIFNKKNRYFNAVILDKLNDLN